MLSLFVFWFYLPGIYKLIVKQENVQIANFYPSFSVKWQNYARLSVKYAFNFVFVILFFGLEVYAFTHNDFYKIPNTVKVTPFKYIYIYIFGTSYYFVTQAAATIRLYKFPEPYKGKGILYKNEKVLRKAGKSGKK